ncbi:polysaccharide pyruvyl transferase family protein [Hydrocarboniphaga sp.]|uniref:polysaccharide pyruvyl transferase family protein n=1 Tax=Hydrocarboniphaga sp. TaxID=2033016 RepID=UPI003D0B91BC
MENKKKIFLPLIGQYHNIGDIILRRPLASWLRPAGELHIFVGKAEQDYIDGLGLLPEDKIYTSFSTFYRAALKAALKGQAHYVFKPGEIQLTVVGMKEHIAVLPLVMLVRAFGGSVARIGAGARNFLPLPRALMYPSNALSQLVYWRDGVTADYLQKGTVMPDLAFWEGAYAKQGSDDGQIRDTVVVSMRGDRPMLGSAWLEGITAFAKQNAYRIEVVTQVLGDEGRARELAAAMGGVAVDWDGNAHGPQEQLLRAIYARSVLAVSDRLHVLIAAYTEGVVPVAPETTPSGKVGRHFAVLDLESVAAALPNPTAARVCEVLEASVNRRQQTLAALPKAREALDGVRRDLLRLINR